MLNKIKSTLNIVINFICNNCTVIITGIVICIITFINFIFSCKRNYDYTGGLVGLANTH